MNLQTRSEVITNLKEETKKTNRSVDKRSDSKEKTPNAFKYSNGILTKYEGSDDNVIIPSWNCGLLVKGIENVSMRGIVYWKWSKEETGPFEKSCIKHITIPSTLEIIGDRSFRECKSLISVEFSSENHLQRIGNSAFSFSGLKSISLPSNLELIDDDCFSCCESLINVDFGSDSHLKSIGKEAFYNSGLQNICLPSNLENIGDECFDAFDADNQ